MADAQLIKDRLRGRWLDALTTLAGLDPSILDGQHHGCPRCEGTDRFRAFGDFRETGGVICNQCHCSKNGDGISTLQWARGISFPEACRMLADYAGVNVNGHGDGNGQLDVVSEIARRKQVPIRSWKAFGAHEAKRGKLTVCRVPMFGSDLQQIGHQDFSTIDKDWLKGKFGAKADGFQVGLFLDVKNPPKEGAGVLLTEGPKDGSALHSVCSENHYVCVGTPGKSLPKAFVSLFCGCDVILIPDRDKGGDDGSAKSAALLKGHARSVKIAVLPLEWTQTDGPGVRELLRQSGGEAQLWSAISEAKEWEPPAAKEGLPSIMAPEGRSDIANARRFIGLHGDQVRYCHAWGRWLVWDGKRWKADDAGAAKRLAKSVSDFVWKEARESGSDVALRFAADSAKARSVAAILSLAACDVPVSPDDLDADPWLLNVQNGTVDLRSGELRSHRREDSITKLCSVAYEPDATPARWHKFINRIFGDDLDLILFVQRWLGYRLSGDIREQLLLIFWGIGSNGKSTLLDTLTWIMGDYADEAPPNLLTERRGGDEHPTEIADLVGKRLIVASESEKGRKMRVQLMKMLTGNARLKGRFTRQDYFTFPRTFEPVLVTNNKPRIRENSNAVWRRVRLVPFNVVIPETEIDDRLQDKLKAEAGAILKWLVDGCLDWQANGLEKPQAVIKATAEYRTESDPLAEFISQCCKTEPGMWVKSSDLREAYESFCSERGDSPVGGDDFTDSLKEHGCGPKRRNKGRGWKGIGLLTDANNHEEPAQQAEMF